MVVSCEVTHVAAQDNGYIHEIAACVTPYRMTCKLAGRSVGLSQMHSVVIVTNLNIHQILAIVLGPKRQWIVLKPRNNHSQAANIVLD